jgi:hypothetical protein
LENVEKSEGVVAREEKEEEELLPDVPEVGPKPKLPRRPNGRPLDQSDRLAIWLLTHSTGNGKQYYCCDTRGKRLQAK